MRVFLAMILGAILTVVGAYSYAVVTAKMATAADVSATVAAEDRPTVNRNVVGKRWQSLETNMREMAARVHEHWTKRSS